MQIPYCKLFLSFVSLLAFVKANIENDGGPRPAHYSDPGRECPELYAYSSQEGKCVHLEPENISTSLRGERCLSGRQLNGRCLTGRPAPA
ncbi:unnamed protein product [Allacma fusca]|uniref:Secreted protein n=1 Tax=Allacma fusca TaxID=39272 RepID=A0A8J2IZJ5_9HEXA|nr:unnamed protein product [Allacma fusca]